MCACEHREAINRLCEVVPGGKAAWKKKVREKTVVLALAFFIIKHKSKKCSDIQMFVLLSIIDHQ